MIIQIAAVAQNYAIGKDNGMLWKLSKDFQRFKALTMGHNIIMGRKTFESLPGVLPGRTHIVISSNPDYIVPDGVILVDSIQSALSKCGHDKHAYIVGGGEIYQQTLSIADKLEITWVHAEFTDADAFYPEFGTEWYQIHTEAHQKDEKHSQNFAFSTYIKKV